MDTTKQLNALVVYFSATGNTQKVAAAIADALKEDAVKVKLLKVDEAAGEELLGYDLVLLGTPSITFLPAKPVMDFIKGKMNLHRERGDIKPQAPRVPGRRAVVFCTYSGPHTGINEATTAVKYMAQFFEHLGFEVIAEWCVVGEYHGNEENSTRGRLGNIKGRPNREDLRKVTDDVHHLVRSVKP